MTSSLARRRCHDDFFAVPYGTAKTGTPGNRWPNLPGDGALSLFCPDGRGHVTGLRSVRGGPIAIIDDDNACCCSQVDPTRSTACRNAAFTSADKFVASSSPRFFNCAITDLEPPGTGGHTLAGMLQQRSPVIPVVLVTARPGAGLGHEAIPVGARCVPRIPSRTRVLFNCVERSPSDDRAPR